MNTRIHLSAPDMSGTEERYLVNALRSGWVAPVGPDLDAFEAEIAQRCGTAHAVGVSSGTAALHLALLALGVGPGDTVVVPTLTFAATANAVVYTGAEPVFVDCEPDTGNVDVALVERAVADLRRADRRVGAVIPVDLFGACADNQRLEALDVPLLEDAAEALGASRDGRPAGSFGRAAALSFNGNKIITTSGGGMLVTDDDALAARCRYLATQARQPVPHYEHVDVGYNYRLSNLLAAVGRGQLAGIDGKIARRRAIKARYAEALGGAAGIAFMPEPSYGVSNAWLTCATIEGAEFGIDRETLRVFLEQRNIESRPVWKPMHLQPVFRGCQIRGGDVAADLFNRGICLPSGSSLTAEQQDTVIAAINEAREVTPAALTAAGAR